MVGSSNAEHEYAIGEFVRQHGLESQVIWRGALYGDDKWLAFGRADLFVHPTLNDYFPLVLLEAMQFGLPIVSTRVGAISEIVTHGTHGLIVEPDDAQALAGAIESLLRDPQRRRRMAVASRCSFLEQYTPERFSNNLSAVFEAEGLIDREVLEK